MSSDAHMGDAGAAASVEADDYAADERLYSVMDDPATIDVLQPIADQEGAAVTPDMLLLNNIWLKYFGDRHPGEIRWNGADNIAEYYRILEVPQEQPPDPAVLDAKLKSLHAEAAGVLREMDQSGLRVREQMAEFMICVVFAKLDACNHFVNTLIKMHNAECMQPADFGPENRGLWRFVPPGSKADMNAGQRARLYALNDLSEKGFRRYRENIVKPVCVRTPSGLKKTCAWELVSTIHDYVKILSGRRLTNSDLWMDLTNGQGASGLKSLEEYLVACDDPEVPEIVTDRTVFSFENGVYMAKQEVFVPYESAEQYFQPNQFPVACKHHRLVFDPAWIKVADPMDIPTPAMDSVMNTQKWSPNVMRWAYVLFGRLFYDVGEFDDWQVVPFLKGLAGTGKSILLNCIRAVYEDADIGIISNTIEKQFGLSAVCDKYLAIADDIRKNMQLDQTEFQNSISGNPVSCAVKFKNPKLVAPWTCTQLWSGNEPPGFHDNSGSVGRRFATMLFALRVLHPDGSLPERLMAELAAFICKANRLYKNMVRRHGTTGVWRILPKEFDAQRAELSAASNALVGLINSEMVRKNEAGQPQQELYMPLEELCRQVNQFAANHNMEKPPWGPDYFRGPLSAAGLEIEPKARKRFYPRGGKRRVTGIYVVGIDMEAACEQAEENGGETFGAAAAAAPDPGPARKRARLGTLDDVRPPPPDENRMVADD